jgi:putative CocE/NonD family hydrolase
MRDSDEHWMSVRAPPTARPVAPRSLHLTMRDGVRIAIDVRTPPGAGGRGPTIVRQTRYLRSLQARFGASAIVGAFDLYARTRRVFLAAGYAWVDVDVRGTGASSGAWITPWSPDEVADGVEVVDWIVRQPWSDGRVGSLGISYDGTCADMLVTKMHPAVRAVAPTFALYDVFTDVAFPGGIALSWFTQRWAAYNAALDRNAFHEGMSIALSLMGVAGLASPKPRAIERLLGLFVRRGEIEGRRPIQRVLGALVRGVRPVDGGSPAAGADRGANMDVHVVGKRITFRDDTGASDAIPEGTIDSFSPHAFRAGAEASGAAIYSYSGWRDGAYQHAAIKRFLSVRTRGSRLTIGPWVHTGRLQVPPRGVARDTAFDHDAELLAFFDEHVRGAPHRGDGHPVHYFTMVEQRWKSAPTWPPPGTTTAALHLGPGRSLLAERAARESTDEIVETGASGTGERSRWRSLLSLVPGDYPDRATRDRSLLYYESAPLVRDMEVTGHPVVVLFVSSADDDAHLFAYLEDVSPDGSVAYVTEGQLRLLHRRLARPPFPYETPAPIHGFARADAAPLAAGEVASVTLDLLPISWLFERGHRVRVVFTGADGDHFEVMAPRTLRVRSSAEHPSRVELPVARSGVDYPTSAASFFGATAR